MKVIKPSFEILDRREMNDYQKIEMAGRIAYKSEDKITEESALPFFCKMFDHGHFPVIEFANLHFKVPLIENSNVLQSFLDLLHHMPYMEFSTSEDSEWIVVSGTYRAFMEGLSNIRDFDSAYKDALVIGFCLSTKCPYQFPYPVDKTVSFEATRITPEEIKQLLPEKKAERHLMCAVKFIVNRAVSHELVRHRPCSFIQESQRYCRYDQNKFGNEVAFITPTAFWQEGAEDQEMSNEWAIWYEAMYNAEKSYFKLLENGASPQAARTVLPNSCKTEIILFARISQWKHIFKLRCSKEAEPSMREVMVPLEPELFKNSHLWE